MYTNSWDPSNGQILISTDYGQTFTASKLPFKVDFLRDEVNLQN